MSRFFGYGQVSSKVKPKRGYGLEAQKKKIKKYASENGMTVSKFYFDNGIREGFDASEDESILKRAALFEMFSALEPDDAVIVLNTSILWSSDVTKALIYREMKKRGARLISVEQSSFDFYEKGPDDYTVHAILEAIEISERLNISVNLSRARTKKALNGDKPGGSTPYGYRYTADKKHVEINPEEAVGVRMIFTEAQKGRSITKIAAYLNEKGISTRRHKGWSEGTVYSIIHNRFYIGELYHQGQVIKGNHEPLISRIQFGKCQAQIARRNRRKTK